MKFKKSLVAIMFSIVMMSVVGCNNEKVKDVPIVEIQKEILVEDLLKQQKSDVDAKDHWIFQDVKDKIIEGVASQALMNVRLQDVFVIKTTDTEAIIKAIETYKEGSLQLFAGGYGGEENATSVANSILKSKGNYVYFIAAPNASEIEKRLLDIIS